MAKETKERMESELEVAQVKVTQAQKVLQAVRLEVKRWQLEGAALDIKYQQVRSNVMVL